MFTKPLESILLPSELKEAYDEISKNSSGLDEVSFIEFQKDLDKNIQTIIDSILQGVYAPEPLKKIEIQKENSNETRPIALSSIKDKIIQKTLYEALQNYFEGQFSNKSYAYRKSKSTLNAINRVSQFLQEGNYFVLKTDIDNFFESIDHDKLLAILDKHIADKSIIRLISLFLQIGGFKAYDYHEHIDGVHQGDILSPLLSNIYLDLMDRYLDKRNIPFVRYADDFVVFDKSTKNLAIIKDKLEKFLANLDLKLEQEKTYTASIKDGFTFLGIHFQGRGKIVDNERLQKSLSKLHKLSKNRFGFHKYIKEVNSYLFALKNYYLKIIEKSSKQFVLLEESLIESIAYKVYLTKQNKQIGTKKEFKILLSQIRFDIVFDSTQIDDKIALIISKGFEHYLSNKSYKESKSKVDKKKNTYAKKFANDTTLHISEHGNMLGISKNKFVIKKYGKVIEAVPFDRVKRVIIEGMGFSISTNVIKKCADNGITVDLISYDALSYASLITYKSTLSQTIHNQAMLLNTPKQHDIAYAFIKGKAKNQINFLKYLDKYHKLLAEHIQKMEQTLSMAQKSITTNELMGYEGSISALYWGALKLILEVPFEGRITYGAKDIVNSSLNYGYAILYGKIQHSLVHAGLSLNISFLHALDSKKPTLTFDMIEEFRSFVVDRTIVAMCNKDEPISLDNKGMLTKKSKFLIAKNIKEKLGSYTMWKKESHKIENIILSQCYLLAKVINGEKEKYKAFVGKY